MLEGFFLGAVVAVLIMVVALYIILSLITKAFEDDCKRILDNAAGSNARMERERYGAQPSLPPLLQRSAAVQREAVALNEIMDEVVGCVWVQSTFPGMGNSKRWKKQPAPKPTTQSSSTSSGVNSSAMVSTSSVANSSSIAAAAVSAAASATAVATSGSTTAGSVNADEDHYEEDSESDSEKNEMFMGLPDEVAVVTSWKQKLATLDKRCRVVLKLNSLFIFGNDNDPACKAAFLLDDCEVSIMRVKPSKCSKRNFICISHPFRTLMNGSREVYMWFLTGPEFERWYEALSFGSHIMDCARAVKAQRNLFSGVGQRCQEIGQRNDTLAAVNAFIHRVWYSYHENAKVLKYLSDKMDLKLTQMKKPSFVQLIRMTHLSVGPQMPYLLSLKLNQISPLGELIMDTELTYSGCISVEMECVCAVQIPLSRKLITVPLTVSAKLLKVDASVRIKILPPPAYRVWVGLHEEPHYEMTFDTKLKTHQSLSIVNVLPPVAPVVEQFLRKEIADMFVLPNMDGIPLPGIKKMRQARDKLFERLRNERLKKQKEELDRIEAENNSAASREEEVVSPAGVKAPSPVTKPQSPVTKLPSPVTKGSPSGVPPAVPSRLHRRKVVPPQPPPQQEMTLMSSASEDAPKTHAGPSNPKSASFQLLPSMLIVPDDDDEYSVDNDSVSEHHRKSSTSLSDSPLSEAISSSSKGANVDSPMKPKKSHSFTRWGRNRSSSQEDADATASFEMSDVSPRMLEEEREMNERPPSLVTKAQPTLPPPVPKRPVPPPVPVRPKPQIPAKTSQSSTASSASVPSEKMESVNLFTEPMPELVSPTSYPTTSSSATSEPHQLFPANTPDLSKPTPSEEIRSPVARTPPMFTATSENPLAASTTDQDEDDDDKPVPTAEKKEEENEKKSDEPSSIPMEEKQEKQLQEEEKKEVIDDVFEQEDNSALLLPEVVPMTTERDSCAVVLDDENPFEKIPQHPEQEAANSSDDPFRDFDSDSKVVQDPFLDPFGDFAENDSSSQMDDDDTRAVPVTTLVTVPANEEAVVPPPRPPKDSKPQGRNSMEIFPDEQKPADPFAVLEPNKDKDELIDELFGAAASPDYFSQSPTHFDSVHHRSPPPPPSQTKQGGTKQQQQGKLPHSTSSHIRASFSEKADRFKQWLK